jgi:hypothetical protein
VGNLTVTFDSKGRKAKCEPNPEYPYGIAVDATFGRGPGCETALPYPAPECGVWIVACSVCGLRLGLTAAGRADDPTKIKVPCKLIGAKQ